MGEFDDDRPTKFDKAWSIFTLLMHGAILTGIASLFSKDDRFGIALKWTLITYAIIVPVILILALYWKKKRKNFLLLLACYGCGSLAMLLALWTQTN